MSMPMWAMGSNEIRMAGCNKQLRQISTRVGVDGSMPALFLLFSNDQQNCDRKMRRQKNGA